MDVTLPRNSSGVDADAGAGAEKTFGRQNSMSGLVGLSFDWGYMCRNIL